MTISEKIIKAIVGEETLENATGLPPNEALGTVLGVVSGLGASQFLYGYTFESATIFAVTMALTLLLGVLGYQLSRRALNRLTLLYTFMVLNLIYLGVYT